MRKSRLTVHSATANAVMGNAVMGNGVMGNAVMGSFARRQKPPIRPARPSRLKVLVPSKHPAVRETVCAGHVPAMSAPFAPLSAPTAPEAVAVKAGRAPGVSKSFSSV